MKNLFVLLAVVYSSTIFGQQLLNHNLPKGQILTNTRNGKEESNIWKLTDDKWLTFNDKIYPFTKDTKGSTLTKIAGWVVLGNKQYRVVLFIQVTSIEIYDNSGKRVNVFD